MNPRDVPDSTWLTPRDDLLASAWTDRDLAWLEFNRRVLEEVVAGDERRTVHAGNSSVKVDLRPPFTPLQPSSAPPTSDPVGVADAPARGHRSPAAAAILSRPVEPNYPLLAKQMKIQGAVVLKVLIGRDGNIQHLNVLSGPEILSAAAREAVKQWRFRPHLQSGAAVETEARITVNFTILTQ